MNLKQLLEKHNVSQRILATALNVSPATVNNIIGKNQWPKTPTKSELVSKLTPFLLSKGVSKTQLDAVFTPAKQSPVKEEEAMLLRKQTLSQHAKKHFSLFANPFTSDIQSVDELYLSRDINYVRTAIYDTAKVGGFTAVIGESGAGKSTLREEFLDRIEREKLSIITISPSVLFAEDNDTKGKTLKSAHIAEAIVNTLAPLENVKQSSEARTRQITRLLTESHRAGNRHMLIIEEAHSLPLPTLKHLKRFHEIKLGFTPLLSILLIGQNELGLKLSEHSQEVREVAQRCVIVTLDPLTQTGLTDYLNHRIKPTGRKLSDIIDESGVTAIASRLTATPVRKGQISRSLLYPLAVGNLITGAMNTAAELGVPVITADVVREA